jgi:spermidine/putrescine transport system substrate-binding protein
VRAMSRAAARAPALGARRVGRASRQVGACRRLVVALLVLTALGCSSDRDTRPTLSLLAWSEYVPQAVIDGFSDETGVKVDYEAFSSNEEMLARLSAGEKKYDLVQPSEYMVEVLVERNALLPLDYAKIPNFVNVAPEFRNPAFDPEQRYTVPWMAGTVGIVVNTERIKGEVRGYKDVFQPRNKGRIVVLDDPREMVSWALASLGLPLNDVTPETLERVRPVLARWLPLIKLFDSDSPKTALLNGDVDIGIVWSGEAALLFNEHPKFNYVLPAEGFHQFVDSLAITAGAPNPDAAHAFINYVLRPEVSRLISHDFPYTNPNLAARKLLTPEERSNPASYPTGRARGETFRNLGDAASSVDRLVKEVRAATY